MHDSDVELRRVLVREPFLADSTKKEHGCRLCGEG